MSTGGNVPAQGVDVQEATTEKKRNDAGKVGKGTAGSRLKSAWRKAGGAKSLKEFARGWKSLSPKLMEDAQLWLLEKSNR